MQKRFFVLILNALFLCTSSGFSQTGFFDSTPGSIPFQGTQLPGISQYDPVSALFWCSGNMPIVPLSFRDISTKFDHLDLSDDDDKDEGCIVLKLAWIPGLIGIGVGIGLLASGGEYAGPGWTVLTISSAFFVTSIVINIVEKTTDK